MFLINMVKYMYKGDVKMKIRSVISKAVLNFKSNTTNTPPTSKTSGVSGVLTGINNSGNKEVENMVITNKVNKSIGDIIDYPTNLTKALTVGDSKSMKWLIEEAGKSQAATGKYPWTSYFNYMEKLKPSSGTPRQDLKGKIYDVKAFNKHIKDNVDLAGRGTRNGVVSSAKSLIVDYALITGNKLRYDQPERQAPNTEGIVNENFYLDCSSFIAWTMYNGGYKVPVEFNPLHGDYLSYTGSFVKWANNDTNDGDDRYAGHLAPVTDNSGKPGDLLVRHVYDPVTGEDTFDGHIVMIMDSYDNGYICAEFGSPTTGGRLRDRSISELKTNGYQLIDMEDYYNNPDNKR